MSFHKIHSACTQSEAAEGSRSPLVWIMSTNAADSMLAMKCRLQCCANIKSSPTTWLCCCLGQDRRPRSFLGTNEVLLDQVLFIGKLDKIWWSQYFLCFDMTGGSWSISNFSFQKHFVHLWFWPLEFHTGQWRHDLPFAKYVWIKSLQPCLENDYPSLVVILYFLVHNISEQEW